MINLWQLFRFINARRSALVVLSIPFFLHSVSGRTGEGRHISITNRSGNNVDVFWVHPDTHELVKVSGDNVVSGSSLQLNSFVGHVFQAIEIPEETNGVCEGETCKTTYFTVNDDENQEFVIKGEVEVSLSSDVTIQEDENMSVSDVCRQKAIQSIQNSGGSMDAYDAITQLLSCMESSVSAQLEQVNEHIAYEARLRSLVAGYAENHTCADYDLPTSEPLKIDHWESNIANHTVKVMHERKRSKIHLVENFIQPEECRAMEEAAKPVLHRATVADVDGGSRFSDARKAMQAGIKVPWSKEGNGDPIATISRRVFDYTNAATNFGLDEFGQEDLMSIQYSGRGLEDESPDRYTPHCDGDCTGLQHKHGTRVATMVMYCAVPEVGGATNFRNSGVHVYPKPGNAVFFSYMGDDGYMDKGFTEHSGCPVIHGEKKIVTQWMRKGVTKDVPWDAYNTLGVLHADAESD